MRITLPFAPIDRQLIKGQVEVSALRFVAALPETYQKYFVAKVGVKVPIPLEEVFQNLPTPTHELTTCAVGSAASRSWARRGSPAHFAAMPVEEVLEPAVVRTAPANLPRSRSRRFPWSRLRNRRPSPCRRLSARRRR